MSGVSRFFVPTGASSVCIKAKDDKLSSLDISLQISAMKYKRSITDEYYTAHYVADYCGSFHCASDCYGTPSDRIKNCLVQGYDYQMAAAGCAGNGCFRCDTACWIGRKYWKRNSDSIRAFTCGSWTPTLEVRLAIDDGKTMTTKSFELTKLSPVEHDGVQLNWLMSEHVPNKEFLATFLPTGKSLCSVPISPKGIPKKNSIGFELHVTEIVLDVIL